MTKTEHYQLPQWEGDDEFKCADFNAAMANIDTTLGNLAASQYVVGSYTGNGLTMAGGGQHVELGFRPRFVIISKGWAATNTVSASTYIASEHLNSGAENYIAFTDTGFTVGLGTSTSTAVPKINTSENTYGFVAFR